MNAVNMSDVIKCPICSCNFASSKIHSHVELCLSREDHRPTRSNTITLSQRELAVPGEQDQNGASIKNISPSTVSPGETVIAQYDPSPYISGKIDHSEVKKGGITDKEMKTNTSNKAAASRSLSDVLGKRRKYSCHSQTVSNESRKKVKITEVECEDMKDMLPNLPTLDEKCLLQTTDSNAKSTHKLNGDTDMHAHASPSNIKNARKINLAKSIPLADQLRPTNFDDYFGQEEMVGEKTSLRTILTSERIPSVIFWGPPGCGKTSLVNIIATRCKTSPLKRFVKLSATTSNIGDVKGAVKIAQNEYAMFKKETILFIDEIHRFNKLQQDYFLPFVENGTVTLIGATTENPSFQVNSALLSRCKVIVLKKHTVTSLMNILKHAVEAIGGKIIEDCSQKQESQDDPCILESALETLANLCDGDARAALNGLEMAFNLQKTDRSNHCIDERHISTIFQRNHVLYDRKGEEHYNIISALHKSIRGSDDNAALYWLSRMLVGGEDPLYIARRLIRIASEDIGIADSEALPKAVAAFQACHFIGMPECEVNLAHMAVYLARAPKSVEVYKAYNAAKRSISTWKGPLPDVPFHLRNAPTKLMKDLGYGQDYKYNPDFNGPIEQDYLPRELKGFDFFTNLNP